MTLSSIGPIGPYDSLADRMDQATEFLRTPWQQRMEKYWMDQKHLIWFKLARTICDVPASPKASCPDCPAPRWFRLLPRVVIRIAYKMRVFKTLEEDFCLDHGFLFWLHNLPDIRNRLVDLTGYSVYGP